MLLSIALVLFVGMSLGGICKALKLPSLIGMLATGIVLGPYVMNLLCPELLAISTDLRKIALIIILTRAGLGMDVSGLKKLGRPALFMCFLPASVELLGMILLGPIFFGITHLEAAILGAVLAAVSPAVVVPRMVKLTEEGYGTEKGIPQLILAGASVDDVFVIILFTTFTGIAQGEQVSAMSFVNLPVSIVLGAGIGYLLGFLGAVLFRRFHMRDTVKVILMLSVSLFLVVCEDALQTPITFASLIAIMFMGIGLQHYREEVAKRLSAKYNKLWIPAEIFLFVLVGATVNVSYLGKVGLRAVLVVLLVLLFRMAGVFLCVIGTKLNAKERAFAMMAYTPKATVQAAIGGIPLAMGLPCGELVLTVAVLAIVLTAPLGAFAIDVSYRRLLKKEERA